MIAHPARYCERCKRAHELNQRVQQQQSNTIYNQKRDKKYIRFYKTKAWRLMSASKLQQEGYICEHQGHRCDKTAVEVHHIDPIQTDTGWLKRLDYDNLKAVCVYCHNEIHQRFGK